MPNLYKFINSNIEEDIISDNGKVIKYKEIYVIANNEENASKEIKEISEYTLEWIDDLGKDWIEYAIN